MPAESYLHDGTAWRKAQDVYLHDGTAWRTAKEIYLHDGTAWRLVFSPGFVFAPTLSGASIANYNLRARAISAGWNQTDALIATITNDTTLYSTSAGVAAFATGSSFPAGSVLTLVNNGYIRGMGGAGGQGGTANSAGAHVPPVNGLAGGDAIQLGFHLNVYNNLEIFGGGGGGGGGGADRVNTNERGGGGGGGGGAGTVAGAGGTAGGGFVAQIGTNATAGAAGGGLSGGAGGAGAFSDFTQFYAGRGGDGGPPGLSGTAGTQGSSGTAGGYGAAGGIPGYAIRRNGWSVPQKLDGTYSDANYRGSVG